LPLQVSKGSLEIRMLLGNRRFFFNHFGTECALFRFTGVQRSAFGPTR
jgi:hypothetical protein